MAFTSRISLLLLTYLCYVTADKMQCKDENGRMVDDGTEWRSMDGNFVKKCEATEYTYQVYIVGCASKSHRRIEVGGRLVEGKIVWICEKNSGGGISLRTEPNPDAECDGGHQPGARWVEGSFQRECVFGGHAKIIGCVTPLGSHIPLGGNVEEQGNIVLCERRSDNTISMRAEPNPNAMCGEHAAGSRWLEENFEMECQTGGRSNIVGCQLTTGERIPLNGEIKYKGYVIHCQRLENGTHRIFSEPDPTADCDGHPAGSRWVQNSFEKECLPGALTRTVGCVLEDGQKIGLGEKTVFKQFLANCNTFSNGTISLSFEINPEAGCGDHKVGDRWVERSFEKVCHPGGRTEIVSCVTTNAATRQRVPLNGFVIVDGQKIHCDKMADGTVRFHGELDPNAPCQDGHAPGSRWTDKGFELECQPGARVEVVACMTPEGNRIDVGNNWLQNGYVYNCDRQADGSVRFHAESAGQFRTRRRH